MIVVGSRRGAEAFPSTPQAHQNAVERTELLEHIFSSSSRIVVFQGPAGHGKTSLMLQAEAACSANQMLTGWLSLNGSDNDLHRFFQNFQGILKKLSAEAKASENDVYELDEGVITSTSDWVLSQLLSLGREVAIFLDDLHDISGRATLSFLRELLANSPSRIRWFLASRVVPEVGLPRLVVGDQALVIHPSDLRFTRGELQRFFSRDCSPALSDPELDVVFAATEGWPAAAQLYRLALRSPSIRHSLLSGKTSHLREMSGYLADNVLGQQEPRIQEFLLKTSILERLSPSQCNALLGRNDSAKTLEELEHLGLFVRRLESQDNWFTYHALFSKFLQEHLEATQKEAMVELHHRAAEWYREHRYFEEALHHLLRAGDYSSACLLFDEWADALIPDGYLATVDHWSAQIPIAELSKFPSLVAKIVWALLFLSRHHKLEPLLPIVRANLENHRTAVDQAIALCMLAILEDNLADSLKYAESIDTHIQTDQRFRVFGLSAVSNARGYVAMSNGNFDVALEMLSHGRALSERANATFTLAYSTAKIGIILFAQGRLPEALVQFRSAMSDSRMLLAESVSKTCLACGLIMSLYEVNEMDGALEQFHQSREMIEEAGLHDYLIICYRAIARIHDQNGRPEEALKILEAVERRAYARQWPRVVELINWERVRRELIAGCLDRAETIANRMSETNIHDNEDWIRFSEEAEDSIIGRIRLSIHAGRYAQAIDSIQRPLRSASVHRRVFRQIKLHLLAALAWHGRGDDKQAQRSLYHAVELAAPGGYLRSFLDEGPTLIQLVQRNLRLQSAVPTSALNQQSLSFLKKIIEIAAVKSPEASYVVSEPNARTEWPLLPKAVPQPLTKKETKILSMLIAYMSNEQIADSLFVSRDTVKYHVKNIYGKLGVKNRLEAIRAAIGLELGSN